MQFYNIKTKGFLLRKITMGDLPHIFEGLSHPDVIKYYGVSYNSMEESEEQIQWYEGLEDNETGIWWAICDTDDTTFYGAIGYNNLSKPNRKAEIGYWLLPEYWKKGIISTVLTSVLSFGIDRLQLHRIEAYIELQNESSKKVLLKQGFVKEGSMKDCEIKNGRFISIDIFAYVVKSDIEQTH